jgi:hypothetical protein
MLFYKIYRKKNTVGCVVAIAGIFVEELLTYTSRNRMHPIGIKYLRKCS